MTAPHVFVTMADIKQFACDAWLLPGNVEPHINVKWHDLPGLLEHIESLDSKDFQAGTQLTLPVTGWGGTVGVPILAPVNQGTETSISQPKDGEEHLKDVVADFVRVGAEIARERRKAGLGLVGRERPLLAMPLFGADRGGYGKDKGKLVRDFLTVLREGSQTYEVDCVLVLFHDQKSYAMAQAIRRTEEGWFTFPTEQFAEVQRLAGHARAGKLVPFIGAGTSVSAGVPMWKGLLKQLAERAGIGAVDAENLVTSKLDALDQAAYIQAVFPDDGPRDFRHAIADIVRVPNYALGTSILASLQSEQAITMNYDDLYERAYAATGKTLSVIPDTHVTMSENWLLKLHGSMNVPESIVLTRDDYLGYSTSREALSAIVKANLITHHMLFVGFGLVDPHFHQIMHDVRRALPGLEGKAFATALTLESDDMIKNLWKSNLEVISMGATSDSPEEQAGAARATEIFLDALAAFATDGHEYLLDSRYKSGLTTAERRLRKKLRKFSRKASASRAVESPSWSRVQGLLRQLGETEDNNPAE